MEYLGLLVPLAPFIMVITIVFIVFYLRFRSKREYQKTIRKMIDTGQGIPVEFIQQHTIPNTPFSHLQRGIKLICIGIAFVAILWLLFGFSEFYWSWGLLGIFIGISEVIVGRLMQKETNQ
ncbi:DUF6249 domain-containing protein [Facilibium subflavum]|uniref:DUF6249 domain-containing protein n=1 Tax=Facilibium subflavum TaxID=2219058 RepID=UPI000E648C50|nr:DUF6249 domain-containing protein [Facilibium subflavum]